MSKRFFPQHHGERKKARLDISISDHNFPLSQNLNSKDSDKADTWGDENDDEILLLASQACEQACNSGSISSLPDYSICMQPGSTSTQIYDQPGPSTSKTGFVFKKPSSSPISTISTTLKDKCDRISSPLPGISSKLTKIGNVSDDLIFNDKIYKDPDSNVIYKQLSQLQEENEKLRSENGKLLEKCVTKEGESSILRTQLKSCQVAVDNARMEKIKAQERIQMEWTEKLAAANSEIHNLRTQLDFKKLEIISVKEKCKMLESSKVKLNQVTVASQDMSISHKYSNSQIFRDSCAPHLKKVKMLSNAVQTEHKIPFVKLHKPCNMESTDVSEILPLILEPTDNQQNLLDYNEKLQIQTGFQNKCNIFSTFHRLPDTSRAKDKAASKITINCIYEDLTSIGKGGASLECLNKKYCNIVNNVMLILKDVQSQLEAISQRVNTAFQKEMDEKYIDVTSSYHIVDKLDLLRGRILYKEEQAILARRVIAVMARVTERDYKQMFDKLEHTSNGQFLILVQKICDLLDDTFCAVPYSGLLLSVTSLLNCIVNNNETTIMQIIKTIVKCRPMPFVSCEVLALLRKIALCDNFLTEFCPRDNTGNLRVDYEQGVLLYKKNSCVLQVLLKQIEATLKCIEKQKLLEPALNTTQNLIAIYANLNNGSSGTQEQNTCGCQLMLLQTMIYALRICAVMLKNSRQTKVVDSEGSAEALWAVCRAGARALGGGAPLAPLAAGAGGSAHGLLLDLSHVMGADTHTHSLHYGNMLSELMATFQAPSEDAPPSYHKQAWLNSFASFSLTD